MRVPLLTYRYVGDQRLRKQIVLAFNSPEFEGIKNEAGLNRFTLLIPQGLAQPERLRQLNEIAINQMKSLVGAAGLRGIAGRGKSKKGED
ncbi:MAG: hypothetical protein M0Z71_06460 [Nitrospiraceae bacterium]|nr:hypothetical protein [Nitrospiraceae bacterium]